MRVKVLHKFTDKYTGEQHLQGDVLDITEERYREIMSVGQLVFKIEQNDSVDAPHGDAEELSNANAEPLRSESARFDDAFESMSVRELKEYADKAYKITFKGGMKKAEIIEELRRLERNGK